MQTMFTKLCSLLIKFLLLVSLQLCFESGLALSPPHADQLAAAAAEHRNAASSYYRHNINGPNSYAFGFEVNDKATGNIQFRDEKRYSNGSVEGSYGYVRPDGSVTITHFTADPEVGYLSQTQTLPAGADDKWLERWPIREASMENGKPQETPTPEVTKDEREKLNLTSILLPVEEIKEQHGIDLNPPQLEKELINPAVLEVINGEAPLVPGNSEKKNDQGIGFATVNQFIPSQFPIAPFELPQGYLGSTAADSGKLHELEKSDSKPPTKRNKSQEVNNSEMTQISPKPLLSSKAAGIQNNDEKSIPLDKLRSHPTTLADREWYERIINKAREKYLRSLKN